MRILLLYNKVPFPLKDGGAIAVHSLATGLQAAGHELHFFALNPSRNFIAPEDVPSELRTALQLRFHPLNTDLKPLSAAYNLLEGSSYHISRFYQKPIAKALEELLVREKFDLIQLEAPFVGPYLPILRRHSQAPVVLRAHNIEHLIWKQLAAGSNNTLKAWYLRLQARRLQKFEQKLWQEVDGIAAISEDDAQFIRQHSPKPVISLPTGLDLAQYRPLQRQELQVQRLGFLGSMDWQPNQEAVRWFAKSLWPALADQFPQLEVSFAGKNFPDALRQLAQPRLHMLGEVPDAATFLRQNPICIVPMRSGSGIRIKLLEAMALALPIVSSSAGAAGLPVEHQQQLLLANKADEFAKAIDQLQKDEEFAFNLGQRARQWVETHYSRSAQTEKLIAFYQQLPS